MARRTFPRAPARRLGARAGRRLARAGRRAALAELLDRRPQVVRPDRDVGRADVAAEVDLADRVLRGLEGELQQAQDGAGVVARDVGLRVAPEDPQQLLAVAEDPPQADLLLRGGQERLLARGAHAVVGDA